MLLVPNVYKMLGEHDYKDYYMLLNKLSGKIDWINDDTIKQGTGKKTQNAVKQKLLSILENDK